MASIVSFCESISSINTEPSDSKEIDQAHLYWVNMVLHSVLGLIDCALSTVSFISFHSELYLLPAIY